MSDNVLILTPAAVLDAVGRAVVATDAGGAIVSWNRSAETLDGWSAAEVLGRNIVEVLVPETFAGPAQDILDGLRMGVQWSGDFWTRHKDGRLLVSRSSTAPCSTTTDGSSPWWASRRRSSMSKEELAEAIARKQ